jgi:hypothetical protein
MKYAIKSSLLAGILLAGAATLSASAELKSIKEIDSAIGSCWHPPSGGKDASVTLRFGFKRDGSLLGPPKASAVQVKGDDKDRKKYVAAAIKAVKGCTPLSFSPDLAKGMAGQVFALSFNSDGSVKLAPVR